MIIVQNFNELLETCLHQLRWGMIEETRLGTVKYLPRPVMAEVTCPEERVIWWADRNCNHFFHIFETIWMFAGSKDVRYLEYFNSNMRNYADGDFINAAYGHRWRFHFGIDQLRNVIRILKADPKSRQAVLTMWCPVNDTLGRRDNACNTHAYFKIWNGALDMTICNRSNDLIWGMCGANCVHFSYLQEFIAGALGVRVGSYFVMTNNLHIYEHHWHLLDTIAWGDHYKSREGPFHLTPILARTDDWEVFLDECQRFIDGATNLKSSWLRYTATPIIGAYYARKEKIGDGMEQIEKCEAGDWKLACQEWIQRKVQS